MVLFDFLPLRVILKLFSFWFIYGLKSKLDHLSADKSYQELHRIRLKKGGTKRKCNFLKFIFIIIKIIYFYNKYIFHGKFSKSYIWISISKDKFLSYLFIVLINF